MKLSTRHRIIRRGNTYTNDPNALPPWKDGLMFLAVNARIEDQFEFIQRLWLNDGDRQRLGATRDFVAGSSQATSTTVIHTAGGPLITSPIPVFVRTMGGEYFFAPSMSGLRALANW
jgi:deferrochelatase/peroxidase EfeB